MKHIFIAGGLAVIALGFVPGARAAVITYDSAGFTSENTPYLDSQSVEQFNPSLGTLESMTFTVSETVSGSVSLWSTVPSQSVTSVTYAGTLYATIPGAGSSTLVNGSPNNLILNEADSSVQLISHFTSIPVGEGNALVKSFSGLNAGSFEYDFNSSTTIDEEGNSFSGGSLLGTFTGTGSTSVDLNSLAQVTVTTSGNVDNSYSDNVDGTLSVSYTYTPSTVPEPGTWMAAGLLCGVAGLHTGRSLWRRKNQPVA